MADRLLSVRNLGISFGKRVVLRQLNFEVNSGDCLAIIGPNGAGKTVLLKALQHLIPYQEEIHWSPEARLGYVPQSVAADRQLPLRVRELLGAKVCVLMKSSHCESDTGWAVILMFDARLCGTNTNVHDSARNQRRQDQRPAFPHLLREEIHAEVS
jgi:energy-coupling factor transporter ATP-binding protein EcfA2